MNSDFIDNLSNLLNKGDSSISFLEQDMSKYQKEVFSKMKNDKVFLSNYSLNDLIFDFDVYFVETLLNIELDLYAEECKEKGIYNKRNGSTKDITVTMSNRSFCFNRPRLRHEDNFDSKFIPKRTKVIEDLSNDIILLYAKNNSVNDIKKILKGMFNIDISTAYISNVTSLVSDSVYEWRNKELDACYFCVNIDCFYITIRDNKNLGSHKIPVYLAVGTKLNGHKEIIGMYLGNEDENKNIIDELRDKNIGESKEFWRNIFNDLKDRGVKKILFIVSDGLSGIKECIKEEFPDAFYQRCIVHLDRNIKKEAGKKNSKEVLKDFKKVYIAPNKDMAFLCINEFKEKYKNKKTIYNKACEYFEYILPLFDLPINIRKYIYTNNIVESVNSKVQRGFYGRGALPNAESAINIIFLNLSDLEEKWQGKKVNNWDNIYHELELLYPCIIKEYLQEDI